MNPYEILGVDSKASVAEIRKAFRKLSKKWHPDVDGGDEAKFREIEEAHRLLTDANERAYYDANGTVREGSRERNQNAELYAIIGMIMQRAMASCKEPSVDNLIDAMHREIAQGREQTVQGMEQRRKAIPRLEAFKKRIKSKGEENILAALLQTEIDAIGQGVEAGNKALEMMARADVWLKDYSYDADRMLESYSMNLTRDVMRSSFFTFRAGTGGF